jgi:RNA polymerase sigma-70 factor (ECF subfamily)
VVPFGFVGERFAAERSAPPSAAVGQGVWSASDEALVAGLGAGDPDVALVFIRRFQSRVFGLALSIVRDRFAAEEVAQDTFVRAWRYAASFDARRGSAAAWLLAIARNAALDHVRARGRRPDQPGTEPVETPIDLVGDDDIASGHDDLAAVADALRSLPAEQRETLMAATYYGFTARELSEAWHVPIGTIKTRLRLAVHKLRDDLRGARL